MARTRRSPFSTWYGRAWMKRPGVAKWLKRMLNKKRRKAGKMELRGSYERGLPRWEQIVNWRDT